VKPITFRIYPDHAAGPKRRRPWYWRVFIFETRADMLVFWRAQCKIQGRTGIDAREDFAAVTTTWHIVLEMAGKKPDRCVGHVLLYRGRLGAGIVAHELGHVTLRWAEEWLKIPSKDLYHHSNRQAHRNEEKVLLVLGSLVSQFWLRFYARVPRSWLKGTQKKG
jgi:hypothetical protein